METITIPRRLWFPEDPFAVPFATRHAEGMERLRHSSVAIVGLARNCGPQLADNLQRLHGLAGMCKSWQMHIQSNDCEDDTLDVLAKFSQQHRQATFHYQMLGRGHYGAEFAGRRTIALAEYRAACQRWVRACAADADYVVVMDFDSWGGFSLHGLVNGIGWLVELPGAYGMASVSLFQHDFGGGVDWYHYDLWALRGVGQRDCYWDTYRNGYGGFGYTFVPPVGSPPVIVASAFGGLCIYRTEAYLAGTYDGAEDCEHVPFHESIAKATGQMLFLNPSQRCVMHWLEASDGHCIDGVPNAAGDA